MTRSRPRHLLPGVCTADTRRVKRLRPKALGISWPLAVLLVVAYGIYLIRIVHGLLTLLAAEWSSYGAVVTAGTVALAVAGLVAIVRRANRKIGV